MPAARPVLCASLGILLALAGLGWLSKLNGQVFDNSLGCLDCLLASMFLFFWGFRDHQQFPRLRYLGYAAVSVLALLCIWVAVQLPTIVE